MLCVEWMRTMKQIRIDNGQLGGTIQIIIQSMFIFNFLTFINTCALAYHSFLYRYVSLSVGIILMVVGAFSWWIIYYSIIYPSIIRFANRQAYTHGSPVKEDFKEIKEMLKDLEEIKEMLKK